MFSKMMTGLCDWLLRCGDVIVSRCLSLEHLQCHWTMRATLLANM